MNEAELLFTEVLKCDRTSLYLNKELRLDKQRYSWISSVLKRRTHGEPLQYILGKTEFMGLEFKVNRDVFIPRQETEILVETVLKMVSSIKYQVSSINILDLGTGSGCIAVSLAKFIPYAKITTLDISLEAIKIARENAVLNNVGDKIEFVHSDLFAQYAIRNTQYDIIVSNPPYIPTIEIERLQPEVRYEPRMALDGGRDGLAFYRKIIRNSAHYLKEKGLLMMEMGFNQREALEDIFQDSWNFKVIEVVKDYNNIDRVIVARRLNFSS
jgi:release factor glutamine methyltransferase